MTFRLPDTEELKRLADELGLPLDDDGAGELAGYMLPFEMGFQFLDDTPACLPPVRFTERGYREPSREEDPLNAWALLAEIPGAGDGPLAGKRVAVKDNMFVAGVPMRYGTDFLNVLPEFDATVVTRVLEAGATVAGKSSCEFLCLHGGSTTSAGGFVGNPHDPDYSAGGSSSGSAALVVSGGADFALGTDQAGSVRIPASWSGAVGMKPTFGLVPFTGVAGLEGTLDHVGPITRTVADNALLLEIIAGPDGYDGRQVERDIPRFSESLGRPIDGLRIGLLEEGFAHEQGSQVACDCVREAAERFRKLGAAVENVSVPLHLPGIAIWSGIFMQPIWHALENNGVQFHVAGLHSPAFVDAMHHWRARANALPVNLRMTMLFGRYMERFGGRYYARARNLLPRLRAAYDAALDGFDLLMLPTTVTQASKLPSSPDAPIDAHVVADLYGTSANTCQFDITGHPALSMPCGMPGGLPAGMMLVGRHFDEATIYRAASAFEEE